MAVSPAITQAEPVLRQRCEKKGLIKPGEELRIVSEPAEDGLRDYFAADKNGKPIRSIGCVTLRPTICD